MPGVFLSPEASIKPSSHVVVVWFQPRAKLKLRDSFVKRSFLNTNCQDNLMKSF